MTELALRPDTAPIFQAPLSAPASLVAWSDAASAAARLVAPLVTTDFVPAQFRPKNNSEEALALARASAVAAVLYGAEAGLSPMQALQGVYVYQGRPALYARTMLAVTLAAGHSVWTERSDDKAAIVCGKRRGSSHVERVEWTIDRARTTGYVDKNAKYKSDPHAMLLARAQSDVCRRVAPDALMGMAYSVEELEDEGPTTTSLQQAPLTPGKRTMRRAAPIAVVPAEPSLDTEDPAVTDKDEPAADEYSLAETGEAITKEQMKKLHASFGDLNIIDREARLDYSSLVIGREIATSNDLTKREASAVIDALTTDINERNEQDAGGAA